MKKMTAEEMVDFISKRYDYYNTRADEYYNDGDYDNSDRLYIIANELRKLIYAMGYDKVL